MSISMVCLIGIDLFRLVHGLLIPGYRHPETVDEMEEDDDNIEPDQPPAMPQIPERFRNANGN